MHTAEHGRPRPEGFLARQRRQLVHARFRGHERVVLGTPEGAETLAEYLRCGPVSRFFSRLSGLLVAITCTFAAVAGLGTLVSGTATGWYIPAIAGFTVVSGYVGVRHLAGWRCMRRHRRGPRGIR